MKNKRRVKSHGVISLLLVLVFLMTGIPITPTAVAQAASVPAMSAKSADVLVGKTYDFKIDNKAKNSKYQWKSSNTSVAKVTNQGTVTGLKKGKATITCQITAQGKVYKLTSTVAVRTPAKSITINNKITELKVGEKYNLNRILSPASSSDKTTWSSSDKTIAKPDKNGIFTALKEGTVTITAKTLSGKKDSVTIKVSDEKITKELTKTDVVDGKINLSNVTYDILTIASSVGDAEIILNHVMVKDQLEMETDAAYSVKAINSEINRVVSLEEKAITSMAVSNSSAADNTPAPTFVAESGTIVVSIDARGNVSVKQEGTAKIGMLTVNRNYGGNIKLNLDGFQGNIVVNTVSNADISIVTKNCTIPEATISGSSSGQQLTFTDASDSANASVINKINVATEAKLRIDVPAKELVIAKEARNAAVTVEKPVEKIVNNGSATNLAVNSNVTSIVSSGENLAVKVTAGSTVKAVELSGSSSRLEVALGSSVENVVSTGNETEITGSGQVKEVRVEGNNTKVNTPNTKVSVDEKATGTTANGSAVAPGTSATPAPTSAPSNPGTPTAPTTAPTPAPTITPAPTGTPTPTDTPTPTGQPTPTANPTPTDIPSTGEKITISIPGEVWAGKAIQLSADKEQIFWRVYEYMNGTSGRATIEPSTGLLSPQSNGTIRVVATSLLNNKVYGAVDIQIQGQRFVKYDSVAPITIDTDMHLTTMDELNKSNLIPTTVGMVYETGNGSETELIQADLYRTVSGVYDGTNTGSYLVQGHAMPSSQYESPNSFTVGIVVNVTVPQSKSITKQRVLDASPLEPIILTEDKHIVNSNDLFDNYLRTKEVTLKTVSGSALTAAIRGYMNLTERNFNGAAIGEYDLELYVPLTTDYYYRSLNTSANHVSWNDSSSIGVPLKVIVQAPQTPETTTTGPAIPDTTQPKHTSQSSAATIESVTLTGVPEELSACSLFDFSNYLTVNTASNKPADKRVEWTIDGYSSSFLNPITGLSAVLYDNTYKIRATSVVDRTKFAEVSVRFTNKKDLVSMTAPEPIVVNEDLHIADFKTLYAKLADQLPTHIIAMDSNGVSIPLRVSGWYYSSQTDGNFIIKPSLVTPLGYNYSSLSAEQKIIFNVPQTQNKIKVVSASFASEVITLVEDKYATSPEYLIQAIHGPNSFNDIRVQAVLEDNSTVELSCIRGGYEIRPVLPINYAFNYTGALGEYYVDYYLSLPSGYELANTSNGPQVRLTQKVVITATQTPKYELVYVVNSPTKLSYTSGESFDLNGILVKVAENAGVEETSVYISYDKFAEYGIVLRKKDNHGEEITHNAPVTSDMNNILICVVNTKNNNAAYFGPITVAP